MRLIIIRKADEIGVKGRSVLTIRARDRLVEKALRDVDAVLVIGSHVKIKSSLPPVLSMHNIPLAILAMDSVSVLVNPIGTRYNNYRKLQYQIEKEKALEIALEYIKAKINGMINMFKYYKKPVPSLPNPPNPTEDASTYEESIRTWESITSHTLWQRLVELIKPDLLNTLRSKYDFTGRKPRHQDPFNKTLSVMYAVLYSLATKALVAAGLDPTYGFLHRTRYSTPLTFDYTEMFKPVAIEATIQMINNEGLPEIDETGELTQEWVRKAIKTLYEYLTLQHKTTRKTIYQQLHLKAFCLAKHLEGKCVRTRLTITWNRTQYKRKRTK